MAQDANAPHSNTRALVASDTQTPAHSNTRALEHSLLIEPFFYADNTEYFLPFAEGMTWLGNSISVVYSVRMPPDQEFRMGVYGNIVYGDEYLDEYSQARPVLSYIYSPGRAFRFVFGNLENPDRHGLHHALLSEQSVYRRYNEYGFQFLGDPGPFHYDIWINWNLLNTPEHREYFNFGGNFLLVVWKFRFLTQYYISHHGGQLHNSGPLSDNAAGLTGLENIYKTGNAVLDSLGWSFFALGDNIPPRGHPNQYGNVGPPSEGFGFLPGAFLSFFKTRLYASYWYGRQFIAEEGSPLFRTEKHYLYWGLSRRTEISGITDFSAELRMHYIQDKFQYEYRFSFRSRLEIFKPDRNGP